MRVFYSVAILLCLQFSAPSFADFNLLDIQESLQIPVRVHATEHILFANTSSALDPDAPPISKFMNEGRIRAEYDAFNFAVHFSNRFTSDTDPIVNKPLVLEKKTLSFENKNWTVQLGDSHQELGRGIALSLFKDEVFGLANTVEGGAVKYTSSSGGFESNVFAGRLRSLKAPVALIPWVDPLQDRDMWMGSLSAKARLVEDTYLGGHYLMTLSRPLGVSEFDKRWHTMGGHFSSEGIFGSVDLYGESNLLVSQDLTNNTNFRPNGVASYGSATYTGFPYRVQAEVKDYRAYYFDFQRPPSLEEDVVRSLNNQDMSIVRLSAWRKFGGGGFVSTDTSNSLAFSRTSTSSPAFQNTIRISALIGEDRVLKGGMRHLVSQAVYTGPWRTLWNARAGYRWVEGQNNLAHTNISVKIPTFTGQNLELGYRLLWTTNNVSTLTSYDDRNYFDVSYTFSDSWQVAFGYEYLPSQSPQQGQHFFNGGTRVAFNHALQARAFIGQTSGGPQCSGGICRTVPAYTGGMLDMSYVF